MYQVNLPQSLKFNEKYRKIPFIPVIRRGFIKQHNVSFAQNHKYPKKQITPSSTDGIKLVILKREARLYKPY